MRKIIYTALIGNYEELKMPVVRTPGWRYICVTDQYSPTIYQKGWEIFHLAKMYDSKHFVYSLSDVLKARYFKLLYWTCLEAEQTIWIDASFVINCDLDEWWEKHFQKEMTCVRHPIRDCVYEEIEVCMRNKRCDSDLLLQQGSVYRGTVPVHNGLIQSGILMRKHSERLIQFCLDWWDEVKWQSTRDQIAFAKVSMGKNFIHYTRWDYRIGQEFKFKTHYNRR